MPAGLAGFRKSHRPGDDPYSFWSATEIGQAANVSVKSIDDNWPFLAQALSDWNIYTPLVSIGLIGTIMKESGSFYPVEEAWWLSDAARNAYYADNRQHAVYQGGPEWHGRGYIQATHRPTYQAFSDAMVARGLGAVVTGLMSKPSIMLQPAVSAQFAAWYFTSHAYPPSGMVAACEARNWAEVRKAIYGAYDPPGAAKIVQAESVLLPLARARDFA